MSTATKSPAIVELTDEEFACIQRESAERHAKEPWAESVEYDTARKAVTVRLRGGSVITVPADAVLGLKDATEAQRADVRVRGGRALFWDSLDVQHTLIAFIADVFGITTAQAIQSRGGKAKSAVKASAVRANGAKGGRPRKATVKTTA